MILPWFLHIVNTYKPGARLETVRKAIKYGVNMMSHEQYDVNSPVKHERVPNLAPEKVKKFQKVGGPRSAQVWFRKPDLI